MNDKIKTVNKRFALKDRLSEYTIKINEIIDFLPENKFANQITNQLIRSRTYRQK